MDGIKVGVSEPPVSGAGIHHDAIGMQMVIRVGDLGKAPVNIRQGDGCQQTKSLEVLLNERGPIVVQDPRQSSPLRYRSHVVRSERGKHRHGDAGTIHIAKLAFRVPSGRWQRVDLMVLVKLKECRGRIVIVNVDEATYPRRSTQRTSA